MSVRALPLFKGIAIKTLRLRWVHHTKCCQFFMNDISRTVCSYMYDEEVKYCISYVWGDADRVSDIRLKPFVCFPFICVNPLYVIVHIDIRTTKSLEMWVLVGNCWQWVLSLLSFIPTFSTYNANVNSFISINFPHFLICVIKWK